MSTRCGRVLFPSPQAQGAHFRRKIFPVYKMTCMVNVGVATENVPEWLAKLSCTRFPMHPPDYGLPAVIKRTRTVRNGKRLRLTLKHCTSPNAPAITPGTPLAVHRPLTASAFGATGGKDVLSATTQAQERRSFVKARVVLDLPREERVHWRHVYRLAAATRTSDAWFGFALRSCGGGSRVLFMIRCGTRSTR